MIKSQDHSDSEGSEHEESKEWTPEQLSDYAPVLEYIRVLRYYFLESTLRGRILHMQTQKNVRYVNVCTEPMHTLSVDELYITQTLAHMESKILTLGGQE